MRKLNIYCDESGISKPHRYFGIGSLWIPWDVEFSLRQEIAEFRQRTGMIREFKWTKVSTPKLVYYKQFCDFLNFHQSIEFRCIIVNKGLLDLGRYFKGDKEAGFYTFYHWLLRHRARSSDDNETYYVYAHQRNTRRRSALAALKSICNNGYRKDGGNCDPFKTMESVTSQEDLIQLCDVLTGAVTMTWNKSYKSDAKCALRSHLEDLSGIPGLCWGTNAWARRKFNVWPWRPKERS